MFSILTKYKRFLKFGIAGVINTIFSYILFALLVYFGVKYWVATILCYLIGLLFNYKTIEKIAFNDANKKSFKYFILIFIFQCGLNIGLLTMLLHMGINEYLAAWIVVIPLAIVGYVLNKKYVFQKNEKNL